MRIKLLLVSKLCSEILYEQEYEIEDTPFRPFDDLTNIIKDNFRSLDEESYKFFWQYSNDRFFSIQNYISFASALNLSTSRNIYLLLEDTIEPWLDNIYLLEAFDKVEQNQKERKKDPYDFTIKTGDCLSTEQEDAVILSEALQTYPDVPRSSEQIIRFALRKAHKQASHTCDFIPYEDLLENVKKGFNISVQVPIPPAEIIIERRSANLTDKLKKRKDKKGKNKKKDKKKKGKKKGKKGDKSKKGKGKKKGKKK